MYKRLQLNYNSEIPKLVSNFVMLCLTLHSYSTAPAFDTTQIYHFFFIKISWNIKINKKWNIWYCIFIDRKKITFFRDSGFRPVQRFKDCHVRIMLNLLTKCYNLICHTFSFIFVVYCLSSLIFFSHNLRFVVAIVVSSNPQQLWKLTSNICVNRHEHVLLGCCFWHLNDS